MTTKDCDALKEEILQWIDNELPDEDCQRLEAHIKKCTRCNGRSDIERQFKELIRRKCEQKVIPGQMIERVRASLRAGI